MKLSSSLEEINPKIGFAHCIPVENELKLDSSL